MQNWFVSFLITGPILIYAGSMWILASRRYDRDPEWREWNSADLARSHRVWGRFFLRVGLATVAIGLVGLGIIG